MSQSLKCCDGFCRDKVVAFDTSNANAYCEGHLRERVLADVKYHYNLHYEFLPVEKEAV